MSHFPLDHTDFNGRVEAGLLIQLATERGDALSDPPALTDAPVDLRIGLASRRARNAITGLLPTFAWPSLTDDSAWGALLTAAEELYDILVDWTIHELSRKRPLVGATNGNRNEPTSLYASSKATKDEWSEFLKGVNSGDGGIVGLTSGSSALVLAEDPVFGPPGVNG